MDRNVESRPTIRKYESRDKVFNFISQYSKYLFILFAALINCMEFWGAPIHCSSTEQVIELFCWMTGTFINPEFMNGTTGTDMVSYGVSTKTYAQSRKYQRYYQFIAPTLCLQALIFYLPCWIWDQWESGQMNYFMAEDNSENGSDQDVNFLSNDEFMKKSGNRIVEYIITMPLFIHRNYAHKYLFCQLLLFCAVAVNVVMWEFFFDGFYLTFLPAILSIVSLDYDVWNRHSSLLFPKVAKCEYFQFGNSGGINKYDVLCVLPQNIVNEVIFAFIFFWNILMVLLCVYKICGYFLLICFKNYRVQSVSKMTGNKHSNFVAAVVTKQGSFGIWFLLHQIRMSVDVEQFNAMIDNLFELLQEVSVKITPRKVKKAPKKNKVKKFTIHIDELNTFLNQRNKKAKRSAVHV